MSPRDLRQQLCHRRALVHEDADIAFRLRPGSSARSSVVSAPAVLPCACERQRAAASGFRSRCPCARWPRRRPAADPAGARCQEAPGRCHLALRNLYAREGQVLISRGKRSSLVGVQGRSCLPSAAAAASRPAPATAVPASPLPRAISCGQNPRWWPIARTSPVSRSAACASPRACCSRASADKPSMIHLRQRQRPATSSMPCVRWCSAASRSFHSRSRSPRPK